MKRLWICSAVLLLTGLLVRFTVYGFAFAGMAMIGLAGILALYAVLGLLKKSRPRIAKALTWTLSLLLCLGVLLWAGMTGFVLHYARSDAPCQADWAIVLGAGVDGTKPSVCLRQRLEAALDYLQTYPKARCVLSGGQGEREDISEAECMYRWLTARGIAGNRLVLEDKAENTMENIRFSMEKLEAMGEKPQKIAIISSEFHLLRAKLAAKRCGLDAVGVAARTENTIMRIHYELREAVGVWKLLIFN